MWLEDANGGVYDVVQELFMGAAKLYQRELRVQPGHVIDGMSKKQLQAVGLHYVAAPEAASNLILQVCARQHQQSLNCMREVLASAAARIPADAQWHALVHSC